SGNAQQAFTCYTCTDCQLPIDENTAKSGSTCGACKQLTFSRNQCFSLTISPRLVIRRLQFNCQARRTDQQSSSAFELPTTNNIASMKFVEIFEFYLIENVNYFNALADGRVVSFNSIIDKGEGHQENLFVVVRSGLEHPREITVNLIHF
ncbi:hypothetical protein T265_13507, partial [Opisthorchis viverrini]